VERSFNIKTELFVKFSFSWFALPFVSIDNVPLLVDLVVFVGDYDISVL